MEIAHFESAARAGGRELIEFSPDAFGGDIDYLIVQGSLRPHELRNGVYKATLVMAPQCTTTFSFDEQDEATFTMLVEDRNGGNVHSWTATITPAARERFEDYARRAGPAPAGPGAAAPLVARNVAELPHVPRFAWDVERLPRIKIPRGQEAMISFDEIADGTIMVDFHDERDRFHRYFTLVDYNRLPRKISPATNRPIVPADITYYVAELDDTMQPHPVIGGRRSNRRMRRTRRTRRNRKGKNTKKSRRPN
jgi:hypothetical protein